MKKQDYKDILNSVNSKETIGGALSINDLKEMEFMGEPLTNEQTQAVRNYEMYRIEELNKLNSRDDDREFHETFKKLQVQANMWPFEEFLKEEYLSGGK